MSGKLLKDTTFLVTCAAGWEQHAQRELRAIVPKARFQGMFLRGNLLMTCGGDHAGALEAVADAVTETVGRVVPLHVQCQIGKQAETLDVLARASDLLPGPDPAASFKAKCHRRGDHEWTSQQAQQAVGMRVEQRTKAPVQFEEPEQLVIIEVFQDTAFLGALWTDELLRKEITRMRKWAPGERPVNRAELKLREIIDKFHLALPAGGRALDVGASPGGWSRVLAEHVAEVVAVDPGELDEKVSVLENVTHLRIRAEALLAMPDVGRFDIVTNDMNMDPDASAKVLCDLAELIAPGGAMVMTVKFVTRRRRELVQAALDVLESEYEGLQVGRVPHNARETTVVGRRRA